MNRTFDYNGFHVSKSNPVQKLNTVKKTVHVDSGDRDMLVYPRNGEFVLYLPRVYENVVSLGIKQAEFPALSSALSYDMVTKQSSLLSTSNLYFFLTLGGLNKSDEGASGADRSAFVDSVFAKFQAAESNAILYTENSGPRIVETYRPSISKLDRLQIKTRLHNQKSNESIFWNTEFSFSLEIETLENSFDDFSSMESRVSERVGSGYVGC